MDSPEKPKTIKLSALLIAVIILVSSVIALMITGVQLFVDYRKDLHQLERRLDSIEDSYLEVIARSVWDYNQEYLKILADGILRLPSFNYVMIAEAEGHIVLEKGVLKESGIMEKVMPLRVRQSGETYAVGTLRITADLQTIYDRQLDRFLLILTTNAVKTFIVSLFILFFLRRILITPLETIARHLERIRGDNLSEPLKIDDTGSVIHSNEIDLVVNNINSMQSNLHNKIQIIGKQNNQLAEKIQLQNKEIHTAFQKKSTLLRMICHDLAQPLSILSAACEYLTDNYQNLSETKRLNVIGKISRASGIGERMIRQIRDLEAIEAGKKEMKITSVNLDQVIRHIQFLYQDRLQEKNINLKVDAPAGLHVMAEPDSFNNQIIGNLIANAIKFSEHDETIAFTATDGGQGEVEIKIIDHGVGMPQDLLDTVFDPAVKTSRKGTDGEAGTGFGMPLVKAFIDAIGGSISIESRTAGGKSSNHGTTITLTLKKSVEQFRSAS